RAVGRRPARGGAAGAAPGRGAARVRAHADRHRAAQRPGQAARGGEAARLGAQYVDAEDQGAGVGRAGVTLWLRLNVEGCQTPFFMRVGEWVRRRRGKMVSDSLAPFDTLAPFSVAAYPRGGRCRR